MSVWKGCQEPERVKSLTRECQEDVKTQEGVKNSQENFKQVSSGDKRVSKDCQEGTIFMSRG